MTFDELQEVLDATTVLAITMFAEARGDGKDGSSVEERIAVGCVIRTRVENAGSTYQKVCWARRQFSCWAPLDGEANFKMTMAIARYAVGKGPWPSSDSERELFEETLYLAAGIEAGLILDRTGGATNYYAPNAMVPKGRIPTWAKGKPARQIGSQMFLKL